MPRTRTSSEEVLEVKIEKAQANVISAKKKYDKATAELKQLLDKREGIRKEKLIAAFSKSAQTFEDVINFLETTPVKEDE